MDEINDIMNDAVKTLRKHILRLYFLVIVTQMLIILICWILRLPEVNNG